MKDIAEFLVKSHDNGTIDTLKKRFAKGNFTPQELQVLEWPHSKERIKKFSKHLLNKYGIEIK